MDKNVKIIFYKRYPNLLRDLEPYINLGNRYVPDEDKEKMNGGIFNINTSVKNSIIFYSIILHINNRKTRENIELSS